MAIQSSETSKATHGSKRAASRPPLPSVHVNPHLLTFDPSRPPSVKFQIITREGQDIVVGRIKIPTPNSQHAFILRRFDTGAVSLTTMFRAAFPGGSDEQERLESQWVKNTYEKSATNGAPQASSGQLRLAGTWVTEATAALIAPDYGLQYVVPALVDALPDPGMTYRKSTKSTPVSPEVTVARLEPPTSPNGPNKRRKESSPTPAQPTRSSARLKSPGAPSSARSTPARKGRASTKAARATQEAQMQSIGAAMDDDDDLPEVPSVDPEEDIAEAKALVQDLKAKREQARVQAPQNHIEALNSLSEAFSLKRTAQEQREGEAEPFARPMNIDGAEDDSTVALRPVAGNRRIGLNLNAEQKALAWGTLAFAFGIGLTSYILPMFS